MSNAARRDAPPGRWSCFSGDRPLASVVRRATTCRSRGDRLRGGHRTLLVSGWKQLAVDIALNVPGCTAPGVWRRGLVGSRHTPALGKKQRPGRVAHLVLAADVIAIEIDPVDRMLRRLSNYLDADHARVPTVEREFQAASMPATMAEAQVVVRSWTVLELYSVEPGVSPGTHA